jgi:hypothetical protein
MNADTLATNLANLTVYCLFKAQLDGDGYVHWNFVAVSDNIAALHEIVSEEIINHQGPIRSLHPGMMTAANNYTIVANTREVHANIEHLLDEAFGFVIQQEKLLRS